MVIISPNCACITAKILDYEAALDGIGGWTYAQIQTLEAVKGYANFCKGMEGEEISAYVPENIVTSIKNQNKNRGHIKLSGFGKETYVLTHIE
jgi:hypothetical protein